MVTDDEHDSDPRRSYPRAQVGFPVSWSNASVTRARSALGDISISGLFMVVTAAMGIRRGTWIRLTVESGQRRIKRSGEVKWVGWHPVHQCYGAGVEFDCVVSDLDKLLFECARPRPARSLG